MNGSATERISMAVTTRVVTPTFSSASCSASALMTVASMPMESAVDRSMPRALAGQAAEDVAAADDDAGLDAELLDLADFLARSAWR